MAAKKTNEETERANAEVGGPKPWVFVLMVVTLYWAINYLDGFDEETDFSEESTYEVMHRASGLEKRFRDNDALLQRHAERVDE